MNIIQQLNCSLAYQHNQYICNNNMILIKGSINNNDIKILIDTGSECSTINYKKVKILMLEQFIDSSKQILLTGISGHDATIGVLWNMIIKINNFDFCKSLHVINTLFQEFDVILGIDFLLQHDTIINTSTKSITFNQNIIIPFHFFEAKNETQIISTFCSYNYHKCIKLNASLFDDNPITILVDTGASVSVIFSDAINRMKFESMVDISHKFILNGFGGQMEARGILWFSELRIKSLPSTFYYNPVTLIVINKTDNYGNIDMILGMDFIRAHNGIINLSTNKINFTNKNKYSIGCDFLC